MEKLIKHHDTLPRIEQLAADLRGALNPHWHVVAVAQHFNPNNPAQGYRLKKAAEDAAKQEEKILSLIKQMTEC